MAGFLFRFETKDGLPADPAATPTWNEGDCIYLGKRTLRVVGKRDDDSDRPPVLIVEEAQRLASTSALPPTEPSTEPFCFMPLLY
jgi:hypothetical protein